MLNRCAHGAGGPRGGAAHGGHEPATVARVRDDFDRIALLPEERWDHNSHYHQLLLRHVPRPCESALEIGCGRGRFSRLLARRAGHVLALDLSPVMVRLARLHSRDLPHLEFRVADGASLPLGESEFGCVVSIATLHHLPVEETLVRMRAALRPGGTLLVLDLVRTAHAGDLALGAVATGLHPILGLVRNGRPRAPRAARRLWAQHGRGDRYLRMREVRDLCARLLPGARVRRHLFWRYSVVWRKPHS